jgi:uncharacterized membrane protein YdjX (TVP38/TMEM64 family)
MRPVFLLAAVAAALGIGYLFWLTGVWEVLVKMLRDDMPLPLFLCLMAVMPAVGFPISPFLVAAGLKFGFTLGAAVAGLATLLHLVCTFGLGHSILRPWILRVLKRRSIRLPVLYAERQHLSAFLFVAIPGLPYSLKNVLLAISGLSFGAYIGLGWTGQMLVALPVIGLGDAAGQRHFPAVIAIALVALGGWFLLKRLYRH